MSDAATRKHHPYSPSKLQSLEACPGYRGDQSTNTAAADAGTRQHDAAEEGIDIDDPRLQDHEAEAVALCKRYRDNILLKYPGGTVIKEEYLPVDDTWITAPDGEKFQGTTAGYCDVAVVSKDGTCAEILDWKFGQWSVEPAENNLQGIAYLLGLVKRYPRLGKVTVHFFMPHRGELEFHTFTGDQFPALYLRVKTVVARAVEVARSGGEAGLSPCVSACLWCAKKGTCPALAGFALKVGKKYSPVTVPENVTPSIFCDPEQSTKSMEVAQLMEAWAKAVRAQITAKTIETEGEWQPEGYTLRSRQDSKIADWRKYLAGARRHGVPGSAIREAITVRKEPISDAISDINPRGQKKAAVQRFNDEMLAEGVLEKEQPIYFLERNRT